MAAAAAGACVAIGLGLRAGAERPPLPHASRTNKTLRSGLCEGLVAGRERRARGLAVALDDLQVLVFRERSAAPRSTSRRLTCAHLWLTRRRPRAATTAEFQEPCSCRKKAEGGVPGPWSGHLHSQPPAARNRPGVQFLTTTCAGAKAARPQQKCPPLA
uniref:Uncharacterized protein n=1 Tax=Molossus molossus TaxID=27622 RepID=A0A7J8FS17_MOLMO|nr:hypothetical protein HJG59_008414 [Molossus molossus]